MDRIKITGGQRLQGTIPISGAKNAALPLMIASLLTDDRLTLKNVPNLADVNLLARILRNHGVDLAVDGKRSGVSPHLGETFHLTARDIADTTAPYEMVSRMRASFWVLGPLIARMREAKVSLPGGCAIGTRPVDLHLTGLKALGAEIDIDGGYVHRAGARRASRARTSSFPKVSVGATHNVLLAAALAIGRDADRERGARARGRRRRALPRQDGRADRRHRHVDAAHPGPRPPRRRRPYRAAGSHRDGHVRLRRGGDRRRRGARRHAHGPARDRARGARSRPAPRSRRPRPACASRATATGSSR